ncbi:hypothetical protein KIW84_033366 [Lathyrus oleraceus]|uniref:Retrotransposon gag domain-containing protein n=1 Tax=Pisum sativum TaxID=3888 RepID=A0A9D4XWF4_PEA|nr:hypothetical protein KIW84_033366 [Pisum sativum]
MKQEKDIWEERFHALIRKHEELQLESKDKHALIEILEDRAVKRQRESDVLSCSSMPQPFVDASNQSIPFMPSGFPWVMSSNFMPEGYAPTFISLPRYNSVMSVPPPVVHTLPCVKDTIYRYESSEGPDVYEKMDEMKDQFLELHKELKTLRGKDLFWKSDVELCLVPNIKILVKFKVPDFEKYKRNTSPLSHLVLYARKMSNQTDNDQLLIHYFQDNLTGAALRWFMGLDSASIRTLNDLGEAFVKQYKYNLDTAPDRDQLRSMSQKDKDTFKEYA